MPPPSPLLLRPISPLAEGQSISPLQLAADAAPSLVIGRTSAADWTVPHPSISRRHAGVELRGGEWLITDLGSRHGTFVNSQRLAQGERLPLRPGDEIRLGAWVCRCDHAHAATSRLTSIVSAPPPTRQQVRKVAASDMAGVAQQRLDALIDASRELEDAAGRTHIAETLARAAAAGSGCSTVVVVRPAGDGEYEQIAPADSGRRVTLSRTLLEAAAEGEVALLTAGAGQFQAAQSIIDLGIQSALCAPIMIEDSLDSLLYIDSRASGRPISADIATFCRALAQLGASAIRRQLTRELEERRGQLERDLDSARRAQQLLMPPRSGARAGLAYCFDSIPGRYVAGDLFGVVDLPGDRTAFFLGDVSGKGAAASLLMAAAQTHLRAILVGGSPLTDALDNLNKFIHEHTETQTFITMVAGIYDPAGRTVELADAGHGLCCSCPSAAPPSRLELDGGLPIGVTDDFAYDSTTIPFPHGARLVMFSDGVIEQTNPENAQFGIDRALEALRPAQDPAADVLALVHAVQAHAQGPLADDLTVVSIIAGP